MARRSNNSSLVPTPPSSSKPASRQRPSSLKRRVVRNSISIVADSISIECTGRAHSEHGTGQINIKPFTQYNVIPPINGDGDRSASNANSAINQTALERHSSKNNNRVTISKGEENHNNNVVEQEKMLYRRGDIFGYKSSNYSNAAEFYVAEIPSTSSNTADVYRCSPEVNKDDKELICLAFRLPNGNRISRYFSKTNRLGDVMVYLCDSFNDGTDVSRLDLYTNEVPTRKLTGMENSLSQLEIKDRMILNVFLEERD